MRLLLNKKKRQELRRGIVEGVNAVEIVVKHHHGGIVELLVISERATSVWGDRIAQIAKLAADSDVLVREATSEVLNVISENSEGIIAVVNIDAINSVEKESGAVVVCKGTSDPGNAGAIVRGAAALGASKVVFTNNAVDIWNPKVIRSSVGAVFQLKTDNAASVKDAIDDLRNSNYQIVALDGTGIDNLPADNLQKVLRSTQADGRGVAFLFGNEAHGLERDDLELVDYIAKIEMPNKNIESLNLAGAVHIVLYEYLQMRGADE